MAEQATGPVGPDLEAGVRLAELPAGALLAGHVGEDTVLLYRDDDGVWAVGGTCTHYSANLADGVVDDGVIRCPWHHACFSLRTGTVLAAPALNDLPRWRTVVEDGVVRVTGREEERPTAPVRPAAEAERVVIIGAGAAGSAAAETLRREAFAGAIVLIDPDADAPYDRPNLSKDFLAGTAPEEWLPLRAQEFWDEHGVERRVESAVAIDVAARRVLLSSGEHVSFTHLLLATGATPVQPPVPGADAPHVHVLRSLQDCRRLIESATSSRSVVIVGASFIGMEAAAALRNRGLAVTVVARETVPFERTLGADLGRMLQTTHEDHDVVFHLGRTLAAIREHEVELDDGAVLAADIVLFGVGVRPLTALAEAAGFGDRDGVPVDAHLETSVPGVYAAGDIALYPDPRSGRAARIEHWVVAQRQGQTAARNIVGRRERFTTVPFFWTQQYDVSVRYSGHARSWDSVEVSGRPEDGDCAVRFREDGTLRAVATVGRDRENLAAEMQLEGQHVD